MRSRRPGMLSPEASSARAELKSEIRIYDLQRRMRNAIVAEHPATDEIAPFLVGARDPRARLAIHRRHYEASLVTALTDKFPAVTWLAGAAFMTEATRAFVHRHPPSMPCIAEYGADFPDFLIG